MQIRVINSPNELFGLKNSWDRLIKGSDYTIFSTWEWLTTWWKFCGNNKKLLILVAEENGAIVGIAPLMYSNYRFLGFHRGKISFIGAPDSDYCDFIIADKREHCLNLFFDYLNTLPEKWNFADLADIPQNAKCLPFLSKISRALKPSDTCPYLPLPSSYEAFLKMLTIKKRKYVKNGIKKLDENFEVEYVDYSKPYNFKEGMEYFIALHQKKWESVGSPGIFSDSKMRNFHLAVAEHFAKKRWLSLYLLKLSGKPVAAEYGFRYNSKYYAYLAGYDPAYAKYSVGNLLFTHIIDCLIQEKITQYDFLRGSEQYKSYWTSASSCNYEAFVDSKGISVSVQNLLDNGFSSINRLRTNFVKNIL